MPSLNRRVSDLLVVGVTSADIAPGAVTFADVGTIYTSNLTEDTNLFFSNTRATVAVAAGSAANALLFVNAAGVLSNTSSLVWTGSNLGVGTATPRLNTANVMAGLTTLTVYNVASEGGGIELATGSSTATAVAGRLTFTSGANNNGFRTLAWIDSLIQGSTAGNQGGSLRFGVKPDNGTAAIALTIDSAGNMGIGKTPVFKLDVSADASINGVRIGLGAGAVSTNTAVGASALAANTSGDQNAAFGTNALAANTTGAGNSAFGRNSLVNNTTGATNTAVGLSALQANTTASENTAVGYQSAYTNITGTKLAAFGFQALYSNTGSNNTGFGYKALTTNSSGSYNSALGDRALASATTASDNSAVGYAALYFNTTGALNTAIGSAALFNNTTASNNTAVGYQAAYSNTTGADNVAVGHQALYTNSTGNNNTAVGLAALNVATGAGNTAVGNGAGNAITTGAKNTIIGRYTGNLGGLDIRTASNYIVLSDGDGNPRLAINGTEWLLAAGGTSTTGDVISNGGGNTSGYNGILIGANMRAITTQANTGLPSWLVDIGGRAADGTTYQLTTADKFRVVRVAAGGSFYGTQAAFEVNSNGCVGLNTSAASTGTGITFPATQLASSNANTLDDYEEGTWTPVDSGGMTGFTAINGTYVKIGNLVHVRGSFSMTSVTTNIFISGLPFASATTYYSVVYSGIAVAIAFARVEAASQIQWNVNATGGGNQTVNFTAWYQV